MSTRSWKIKNFLCFAVLEIKKKRIMEQEEIADSIVIFHNFFHALCFHYFKVRLLFHFSGFLFHFKCTFSENSESKKWVNWLFSISKLFRNCWKWELLWWWCYCWRLFLWVLKNSFLWIFWKILKFLFRVLSRLWNVKLMS